MYVCMYVCMYVMPTSPKIPLVNKLLTRPIYN